MSYSDWRKSHTAKLVSLIESLPPLTVPALIDYFAYDHMRTAHPDFCELYPSATKCHSNPSLNCLFCACPHFQLHNPPVDSDGTKCLSSCSIGSTKSKQFTVNSSSHCDCSDCFLPHYKGHINQLLAEVDTIPALISYIRRYNA